MSTQENDLRAFYEFLGHQLENGGRNLSPQQCVDAYQAYQDEVRRLNERIQASINSGPATQLDRDALMEEIRTELAEEGITD
jgi:hypothetical protein